MLKEYLAEEQDEWDQYLGCLAGAYMSTPNESTKLTPNLLALGREIRLPADLVYGVEDGETETVDEYEYIQSLKDHMPMAHEVARKYLKANVKRSKGAYDTRAVFHNYQPGDKDWCLHETRKVGVAPKLEKRHMS